MSNYPVSQKIAIIQEVNDESSIVWSMLNDHSDNYSEEDIKHLFINILNKDKDSHTRFDLKACEAYIEKAAVWDYTNNKLRTHSRKYDVLHSCYLATRKERLHSFLFNKVDDE